MHERGVTVTPAPQVTEHWLVAFVTHWYVMQAGILQGEFDETPVQTAPAIRSWLYKTIIIYHAGPSGHFSGKKSLLSRSTFPPLLFPLLELVWTVEWFLTTRKNRTNFCCEVTQKVAFCNQGRRGCFRKLVRLESTFDQKSSSNLF